MMSSVLVTLSPRRNACSQSLHAQSWVFDLISASVLTHHRHLRCLGLPPPLLELLHPQSRLDDNDSGSHGEAHPVFPHLGSKGFDLPALSRPRATENRKTWDMNDNTLPCQAGRTKVQKLVGLSYWRPVVPLRKLRPLSEFGRKNCDGANVTKRRAPENWSVKPLRFMDRKIQRKRMSTHIPLRWPMIES